MGKMRKKISVLFIILFTTFFLSQCTLGKTFFNNQQYIFSDEYNNRGESRETLIKAFDYYDSLIIEIIGWSRDGKIAYRYITPKVEDAYWEYRFSIVNLLDDCVMEYDYLKMTPLLEEIKKELSEAYKTKWNFLLKKYDIIGTVNDPFKEINKNNYNNFPIDDFECWFDYSIKRNKNNFANLIDWKLIIGNNKVQKIISQATERGYYDIDSLKILGYYKSPYENRIAVFVSCHDISGWFYDTPRFYGCNMDTGFSPKTNP